jgi:integrase
MKTRIVKRDTPTKDGKQWWVEVRRNRKTYRKSFRRRMDAQAFVEELNFRLLMGSPTPDKHYSSWGDFLKMLHRMREVTDKRKRILVRIERWFDPQDLGDLNEAMLDLYVQRRRKDKVGTRLLEPATILRDMMEIMRMLRLAHRHGILDRVPVAPTIRVSRKVFPVITPDQFDRVFAHAADPRVVKIPSGLRTMDSSYPRITPVQWWQGLLAFLYTTGRRISETLAVRRENVDLANRQVRIEWRTTKSKREDIVVVSESIVPYLEPLMGTCSKGVLFKDHCIRTDEPHGASALRHQLKAICAAAEVEVTGFHTFRRSFATNNADRMDLFELQQLMGHANLETTRRYVSMAHRVKSSADKAFVPTIFNPRDDKEQTA